ncbi:MAG: rhodanese-like domain-containing protein [Variibacter sp.]
MHSGGEKVQRVGADALRRMLTDGEELALLDMREELTFSQNHLLHARSLPLSRLEMKMARLVPRRGTRIVLCDDDDGLAERAAAILRRAGYTDMSVLDGGVGAWAAAGYELFSGVNVPSKAFGEFVEHDSGTPNVGADELARMMRAGEDIVVLDSRPFDEYSRISIPTSTNVPGAELVLRVHDLAPSPATTVVVNCAGRTRSIIGAQSLINAGIPNKVVALRNGTMGWTLAGFQCDSGKNRRALDVSAGGLANAKVAAQRVAQRFGVTVIERATFDHWRAEADTRTLYVFDVRNPDEYEAGHVPGAISAPGGQLVQATDQYVGTLRARIVLVDDKAVRAIMTASWLLQMGWTDVAVLTESGTETGWPAAPLIGDPPRRDLAIAPAKLAALLAKNAATVVDLSYSREYHRAHISGAWFAIRSQLAQALATIAASKGLVFTSEDGTLAALAASDATAMTDRRVRYLDGGNAAWKAAGYPLTADDPRLANEAVDLWLKPYERAANVQDAMNEYLSWEVDLLDRIRRDESVKFRSAATP